MPQELYATTATASARQALRQWMLTQLAHFADHQPRLTIDVNIDPWQFHYPDVWDYLAQLRQVGPQINIEITERNESSFDAAANFGRLLARAQNLGFAISLAEAYLTRAESNFPSCCSNTVTSRVNCSLPGPGRSWRRAATWIWSWKGLKTNSWPKPCSSKAAIINRAFIGSAPSR